MSKTHIIKRHPGNPVLTSGQAPYDSSLVFNAGVAKFRDRYIMVFRNDYGFADRENFQANFGQTRRLNTNIGIAFSDDGVSWEVDPEPCFEMYDEEIRRAYDPRLTVIEDRCYMCFAVDTHHGIRGGLAVTENFKDFEILSLSAPDNRNMVLFPDRPGGHFMRLERPFPVYGRPGKSKEAFDIWFSDSPDGRYWGNTHLVLASEDVPWCNNKLGPGAPPILTDAGWLALIHVVDFDENRTQDGWERKPWQKRYTVGAILLDRDEPWRVTGLTREPVMVPETDYERQGFRGDVIFPGGFVPEDDGTVKIYYGSADTVEALATARIDDLVAACEPFSRGAKA